MDTSPLKTIIESAIKFDKNLENELMSSVYKSLGLCLSSGCISLATGYIMPLAIGFISSSAILLVEKNRQESMPPVLPEDIDSICEWAERQKHPQSSLSKLRDESTSHRWQFIIDCASKKINQRNSSN